MHSSGSAPIACFFLPKVTCYTNNITAANAVAILSQYDVVADATDNAPTRYLLSDTCAVLRIPLVSGAAIGTDG